MCCHSLNLKRSLELSVIERHGYSVRFIEYWLYYACAGTVPGMIASLTRNIIIIVLNSSRMDSSSFSERNSYAKE